MYTYTCVSSFPDSTALLSGKYALQLIATHCNALQCTATRCNTLELTATHWNTLTHIYTRKCISHVSGYYDCRFLLIHIYIYPYMYTHTDIHTKKCVCIYTYRYISIYTHIHAHTRIYNIKYIIQQFTSTQDVYLTAQLARRCCCRTRCRHP